MLLAKQQTSLQNRIHYICGIKQQNAKALSFSFRQSESSVNSSEKLDVVERLAKKGNRSCLRSFASHLWFVMR
jgi:hypothetical protein